MPRSVRGFALGCEAASARRGCGSGILGARVMELWWAIYNFFLNEKVLEVGVGMGKWQGRDLMGSE